jgi:hypothetical protein
MMKRYINLDRLIFCLEDEWAWHSKKSERGLRTAMQIVKEQPIVDAVEVVRCKNCVHFKLLKDGGSICDHLRGRFLHPSPDDYCSYAERIEEK